MEDTKKIDAKVNNIRKLAGELFAEIENFAKQNEGTVDVPETLADEIGELLSTSKGFRELLWTYRVAAPASQKAEHDLEASTWYMSDEALEEFFNLSLAANKVIYLWKCSRQDQTKIQALSTWIEDGLGKRNPEILHVLGMEWESRATSYRLEMNELKSAT